MYVYNVGVLWPNSWMDQDDTWYGGMGLGPGHIVLDRDPTPPLSKGGHNSSPTLRTQLRCDLIKRQDG